MDLSQNEMERLRDQIDKGEMTPAQANVAKVRMQRVLLVTARVPADMRRALNAAVRAGELAHLSKDGHKPEAYYHPTFEYLARGERAAHEGRVANALRTAYGWTAP